MADGVVACVDYILGHQSEDGNWIDWELPPGASDYWTTAYVGFQLAGIPGSLGRRIATQRHEAARWLAAGEVDGGGWAYNDQVGSDCDSTAFAILFLWAEGIPPSRSSCTRLIEFQQPDGGFATYPPDEGLGSWGLSHPDVSAVAARALMGVDGPRGSAFARVARYLAGARNTDGTWSSFWWSTPLYATAAALVLPCILGTRTRMERVRETLARTEAVSNFERALLLECHLLADGDPRAVDALARSLLSDQLPDGSWASTPILRLSSRECPDPSASADGGPLFADPRRLFTSATVLRALSGVARLSG